MALKPTKAQYEFQNVGNQYYAVLSGEFQCDNPICSASSQSSIHCVSSEFNHVFTWLHRRMGIAGSAIADVSWFSTEDWTNHNGRSILDRLDRMHWRTIRNVFVWHFHQFHGLQTRNGISGHTGRHVLAGHIVWRFGKSHNIREVFGRLDWGRYSVIDHIVRGWDRRR